MVSGYFAFPLRRHKAVNPVNPTEAKHLKELKNQRAFTLLEILLAIFIFVIVLSTIYTAYTGTFRNMDIAASQADIYQMARIALERMVEDLQSAYILPQVEESESEEKAPQPASFVGEKLEINGRSAGALRFLSRAHLLFTDEDQPAGIAEILYDVREGEEEGGGFVLYRSDTPWFEQGPEAGAGGWVLCDGLHAVDFKYYDEEGEEYEKWDSTMEEFNGKLPIMVSISLEFVNKRNPEAPLKFMTGVALPMAGEAYEQAS
jgi:general secretion pathway protein J